VSYADFVAHKALAVPAVGLTGKIAVSKKLFPFQRDIVTWALRRGRAAIFADCGMGKTPMQLEWAHRVVKHTGGRVLILAPLAVAQQTVREGAKFGIEARYCREQAQVGDGITIANYEMLPHFDAASFAGVVLDESSILKAYDGKTRTAIIEAFAKTPFRLACTATPAPNDFMELGNHSEFLGTMTRAEMLAMFFVHDGGETQQWRLKGHAESEFWRWVCQWAAMIRKPSDLGYDDGAFILPPLVIHEHVVTVDHKEAHAGGMLFKLEALTLEEQRAARRSTIEKRVAEAARLAGASAEPWLIWCELNAEGDALAAAITGAVQVAGSDVNDAKERAMLDFAEGRVRVLVTKPSIAGYGLNWQHCPNVAFVGLSHSYEQFYQAVRRCWRFGQTRPVHCHVITAETEGRVVANIQRKEKDALRMAESMVASMREIQRAEITGLGRQQTGYAPTVAMAIPRWLDSEAA
jgi:hypothetical protein